MPRFAHALALVGDLPLRRHADGFTALLDAIVGQQVSVASANAIWARMEAAGVVRSGAGGLAATDEFARGGADPAEGALCARRWRILALISTACGLMPDEVVIAELVAVPGIGRWTAEIYAMFALGRADVFAPGDLALQEAARHLFGLEARPNRKGPAGDGRGVEPVAGGCGAVLWAYYHVAKSREGI